MVNHFIQERQNQKTHTYLLCKPRLLIESLFSLVFKRLIFPFNIDSQNSLDRVPFCQSGDGLSLLFYTGVVS